MKSSLRNTADDNVNRIIHLRQIPSANDTLSFHFILLPNGYMLRENDWLYYWKRRANVRFIFQYCDMLLRNSQVWWGVFYLRGISTILHTVSIYLMSYSATTYSFTLQWYQLKPNCTSLYGTCFPQMQNENSWKPRTRKSAWCTSKETDASHADVS